MKLTCGLLAALAILIASPAIAADIAGAQDHPLITRFKGAEITDYKVTDYDVSVMPVKAIADERDVQPDAIMTVEGKVTRISYSLPSTKTSLEVMRNYEKALSTGRFKTIFSCAGEACGKTEGLSLGAYIVNGGKISPPAFGRTSFNPGNRYLVAERDDPSGKVYALVYVMQDDSNDITPVYLQVTEVQPMQTGQVDVLDAAAMKQGLESEGKVAIYGVYFDTAKAEIKPDSKAALEQMAKLLTDDPSLKVYIVGHTDNVGTLPVNIELSQKRAEAVAKALQGYKIDSGRLVAKGVASLAPVAPNATEAGRARNRRVELVVQ